jgi:hypothetical protein
MRLDLYNKVDKKLLAQVVETNIARADTEGLSKAAEVNLIKLLKKIPYDGLVLSRESNRVTINMGSNDGIVNDQIIPVIQIAAVERHPKFDFIVKTQKDILGRIKINKADKTLSFGRIMNETTAGAITVGSKISGLENVTYANVNTWSESQDDESALLERPDANLNFGEAPKEWLPTKIPTFGMLGARLGLGTFNENFNDGTDSLNLSSVIYPFMALHAELWLTPQWSMHFDLRQGMLSSENPKAGGKPSDLSHSLSSYDFLMGYNLRLGPTLSAAKVEFLGGFSNYRLYVDKSVPQGLVTRTYSGPKFGLTGSYPIADKSAFSAGANLFFILSPKMSEDPATSGDSQNDVKQFGVFLDQQFKVNLKARYALDFELYASDFSAGGSASQKFTNLSAGLFYMF